MRARHRHVAEIAAGGAIILALVAFIASAFSGNLRVADDRYVLLARFTRVDGLTIGSEVRTAGIAIGTVTALELDERNQAVVVMRIDPDVRFDIDATAAIVTDGLFGAKFVRLDIGGADEMIESGGEIFLTQEALIIEDLLELIIRQGRDRLARERKSTAG